MLLLLTAFAWGALHALSPGHGKAMVAAYLVGARGTARHAVALGATVTLTHTAGVFALGLVALGLSEYVLPEDLYPWLNLASGLLVLGVGASVLRKNLRAAARHHHHTTITTATTRRRAALVARIVAMGTAAGLIPCPSALVVLLGAIAQGQIALGMVMIVAFSLGLATTLTAARPRRRVGRPDARAAQRPGPRRHRPARRLGAADRRRGHRPDRAGGARVA